MKRWPAFAWQPLFAAAVVAGCDRNDDTPPTREGVPGTGGVGGSGGTSAGDTTDGRGNYGTSSPVLPRGATAGELSNPSSPVSTVLPGTTHPGTPGTARQ